MTGDDHAVHLRLCEAAALVHGGKQGQAARLLREILSRRPDHAMALSMLSDIAISQGHDRPALDLLTRCLKKEPGLQAARSKRVQVLLRIGSVAAAMEDVEILLAKDPRDPQFRALKAQALEAVEDHAAAAEIWRALAEEYPDEPAGWIRYGTALRLLGRREECIAAYRRALAIDPSSGEAWWALADLKTFRLDDAEVARMQAQLRRADIAKPDQVRLHFALGKANADRAHHEAAFSHYAQGNALHRSTLKHDPAVLGAYVAGCKQFFTREFFEQRSGFGSPGAGPVFVVGMMRAGSTLVEQILASHSQIEATRELADLSTISRQLQADATSKGIDYWQRLALIDAEEAARLGERYRAAVEPHRRLGRPLFLDKMGANFALIGLIRLILPDAKLIDVRRHPMACGLSIFTQLFPSGQNDCYRLEEIGLLYRRYVELCAHFDAVLPGLVHRVFYEDLVGQPGAEVRRLCDYLGLPFEPACLDFHQSSRVVTTVSAEQVRRPIYQDALEQWRYYEPWLGPLAQSLGPVLEAYPSVPPHWG
jgi:tetratricopeptide (TPR) repeat protein